ncbi:hypothetical protein [Fundidesulfovibrio terrae]|uniref:hypothetical protein n=1 Tax=Fundidesulfovibrio terrae TaxID=2922866 RepID=UPI001FAF7A12|nr:hypothetical protein [Fundidesulfovibrio terrae]
MAYRYDLKIDQGATLALEIECQDDAGNPMALSGYSASAQVRYRYADTSPAAVFACTLNETPGLVSLKLGAAQTAALSKPFGVWDCELTAPDGTVQRLAEGKVAVSPEVSR